VNWHSCRFSPRPAAPASGLILVSFCALVGCARESGQPRLYCSAKAIDLGVLDPSRENPFSIQLENRGSAPLLIAKASASCGCAIIEPPGTIGPGRHGLLRGQIHVRPGSGWSEIRIASNDPEGNHTLRLRWSGRGVPTLIPSSVRLSARLGQRIQTGLEISYPSGVPFEFLGASELPKGWSITLVDNKAHALQADPYLSSTSAVGKASLRLDAIAPASLEKLDALGLIAVRYGSERHELKLAISIEGHDGLRAVPDRLLFSSDSLAGLLSLERFVRLEPVAPDDHLEVVRKPGYLSVTVERGPQTGVRGKRHSVVVKAKVTAPPPDRFGKAKVELRDRAGRRVLIPILLSYDT
jgi:hypothetical protein